MRMALRLARDPSHADDLGGRHRRHAARDDRPPDGKDRGFDHDKILVVDVGPDVYGHPMHDKLINYLFPIVQDWKNKGFKLISATGRQLPLVKA